MTAVNKKKVDEVTKCPECDSVKIIMDYDRGEMVCDACGLVIDDQYIDPGQEWRSFDTDQDASRRRTGPPSTFTRHDKGLTTEISPFNRDSYGKSIPAKNRAEIYRMRKWQRRIRIINATERNLAYALGELDRLSSNLGLPRNIRETAAVIYRKAVTKNLIRGRSIEGVVAASLYAACRKCNVPRTLDEIAEASRVGRKEIGRTYRFMTRSLRLHLLPTSPQDYISRFCSKLHLSGEAELKAMEIVTELTNREILSGRGPTGMAAAAIYIASIMCSERRTQREVADVSGVTEVTIRNRYKEMAKLLDIQITL